jgi:hypothetical protein
VAEPLRLHGFQVIDELNRAFAGEAPSGYSAPVHLFTPANVKSDRGPGGIYDPANGYEQEYRKGLGQDFELNQAAAALETRRPGPRSGSGLSRLKTEYEDIRWRIWKRRNIRRT